jgi:anaerobic magnesium-protoporphyrin IX monomethyl ester cyclase
VGFTMLSCDFDNVLQAARIVKEISPQTIIMAGGPHPSIMPEDLEPHSEIDVIFQGEGEVTFPLLLAQIERGEKLPRLVRGEPPDLDAIPFAARDLFPSPEIPETSLYFDLPFVTIIAGRGCRYNCSFCQPAERMMFGKHVRRRSVENVMAELNLLRDQVSFKSLMIHDDCLTEDPEWVAKFCDEYQRQGFTAPFICQSRADLIVKHEDLVRRMREVGLKILVIGFESGSDRVLKFIRKGATVETNFEAARICRKLGIRIWANYMLGLPTETQDEIRQTVAMIRKIRPDFCSAAYFTPHPGSDLFTYCQENDLSLINCYEDYSRDPGSAKIKGVDYVFLEQMLNESLRARHYHPLDRMARWSRSIHVPAPIRRFVKSLLVRRYSDGQLLGIPKK